MKKIMMILMVVMFAFTCVGGSIFILADLPAAIQEDKDKDSFDDGSDNETKVTATNYWDTMTYYRASSFSGGDGSSSSPYLIDSAAELALLSYYSNQSSYYSSYNSKYYKLTNDIDLSAHYWVPIGAKYVFSGEFNGNSHNIKGMTCYMESATDSHYYASADNANSYICALFGKLYGGAIVYNFSMSDVSITTAAVSMESKYYKFCAVAGLALSSSDESPMIFNINLFGNMKSSLTGSATEFYMAGAVGYGEGMYVSGIMNYMTMYDVSGMSTSSSSSSICGGIVANAASSSTVANCAMLGYIDFYGFGGGNTYAGGIVGQLSGSSTLKTSYATRGTAYSSTSSNYFWLSRHCGGGIVGNLSDGGSKVISCWSFMSVKLNSGGTGSTFNGLMVGYNNGTLKCLAYGSTFYSSSTNLYGKQNGSVSNIAALTESTFKRSSSFNTYMNQTGGESWYTSTWYYNSSSYWHLNYGFPVIAANILQPNGFSNDYTSSVRVKATGTGVDTSYSSGGNGSDSYGYSLIGGSFTITTTAKTGCYFRGIYGNYATGVIAESSGTSSTNTTTCSSLGANSVNTTYGWKNYYFNALCSAPTTSYWQNNYASAFAGGSGTSSSPYLISNGAQLARLAYLSNSSSNYESYNDKYYKLTNDIELSGLIWTPIGKNYNFTGNFDGNGYTINGLWCKYFCGIDPIYVGTRYYNSTTTAAAFMVGLFGQVNGTLTNFVLTNTQVGDTESYSQLIIFDEPLYVGSVCGIFSGNKGTEASIKKVGAFGHVAISIADTSGYLHVGGLVGLLVSDAKLEQSFNSQFITYETTYFTKWSLAYVGGIIGSIQSEYNYNSYVYDCYNNGSVSSYAYYTGGLIGAANLDGTSTSNGTIIRCYNIGDVSGCYYIGGLVGKAGLLYNCFVDANVSTLYTTNKFGVRSTVSYMGAFSGLAGGTWSYCGYNSGKVSSLYGSGSTSTTGTTSFTSSSTYRPNYNVSSFSPYNNGTYTWSKTTGMSSWTATSTPTYVWTMPSSSYTYINNRYPVLSWSIRYRTVSTNFSSCGTTYMKLTGAGTSDTRTTGTSAYTVLGSGVTISTTETSGSYGIYSGIYEVDAAGTKKLAVTETRQYLFSKASTFNQLRIYVGGSASTAYVTFDISSFSDGTSYRLCYQDYNTYSSSTDMNKAATILGIYFQKLSSSSTNSWSSVNAPSYTLSGATIASSSGVLNMTATAVTGNYYTSSYVQVLSSGNFISSLSYQNSYPTTYNTYVKGNAPSGTAYYGVYSGKPVTTIAKVVAYTPTESGVNYPSSATICGSIYGTYYTSGNPFITTSSTTSSSTSLSFTSRVYKATGFTAYAGIEAWEFKGWYSSTSSTISASTCSGTPLSTSTSWSWTPSNDTTTYIYAVYVPRTTSTIFNGVWTSEDGGATYSRKYASSITTDSVTCTYPSAYIKYVKQTYSAIINETQTTQSSQTSSTMLIVHTEGKKYDLGINSSSYYEFEGWYYVNGSDNLTSSNISTASCITTSTTFTLSTGTLPPGVFAKFKRKILTITAYVMTDDGGGTYTNSNVGGKPVYTYYNASNVKTTQDMSSVSIYPNSIQSGTPIRFTNYGTSNGYVYMGYSLSNATTPTAATRGITVVSSGISSDITLRFYYKKVSGNTLKYVSKNSTEYASDYTVGTVSSYSFVKNDAGFWESQNFGVHNSYALAKVSFNLKAAGDVVFEIINYAESSCDYGIFSNIDTTLTSSYTPDSTNVYKSFSGQQSANIKQVIYNNVSAGDHFVYIKYRKDGSVNSNNDSLQFRLATEISNHSYYYLEHGKYPQSYVGDTLNTQMINDNSNVTQTSAKITYFNGKANVDIPIYKYKDEEYVRLKPDADFTIKLNGVSKTFSTSMYYYFKVEPIRWRVSDYEPTAVPTRWGSYATNYAGFAAVSDKVLGVGAVNALTTKEGWRYVESNLYNNVKDSNAYVDPQMYFGTNELSENWRYGDAGQQEKVVYDTGTIEDYKGIRVASFGEISYFANGLESTINENTLAKYARAEYTDFVGFILKKNSGTYGEYWTRNLGNGINNGKVIDSTGFQRNAWLNQMKGVRFAVLFTESSRIF